MTFFHILMKGGINMTNNQNSKIELRINEELKLKFINYAKQKNMKISDILRNYIESCVDDGKTN